MDTQILCTAHLCVMQLPALQDDGPPTDYYGRFSNRDRGFRGGSRGQRGFSNSRGLDRDSNDEGRFGNRRGGRSNRSNSSWSSSPRESSRDSADDWLIGGGRYGRSRDSSRDSASDWLTGGGRSGRSSSYANRDR